MITGFADKETEKVFNRFSRFLRNRSSCQEFSKRIPPEISQRLSVYFGMSELFFYRLQVKIDERNVEREVKYA